MASFFSCQYMKIHKHPPYKTICRVKLATGLIEKIIHATCGCKIKKLRRKAVNA